MEKLLYIAFVLLSINLFCSRKSCEPTTVKTEVKVKVAEKVKEKVEDKVIHEKDSIVGKVDTTKVIKKETKKSSGPKYHSTKSPFGSDIYFHQDDDLIFIEF
jgi:hypothetical protein